MLAGLSPPSRNHSVSAPPSRSHSGRTPAGLVITTGKQEMRSVPVPASPPTAESTRAYWCTSCNAKSPDRSGWLRHEEEFHERYKKYPCPDCHRVFWGSATYLQHFQTAHDSRGRMSVVSLDRVVRYTRTRRAWGCGFCAAFLPSRERFYQHVGLHYQSGKTQAHWYHSNVIYGLLHQKSVHQAWKNFIQITYGHLRSGSQPMFSWHPRKTGRADGFQEDDKASGNLQDRLEFFRSGVDSVQQLVQLAHDQADIVTPADFPITSEQAPLSPSLSSPWCGSSPFVVSPRPQSCPRRLETRRLPTSTREEREEDALPPGPPRFSFRAILPRHFSAPLLRQSPSASSLVAREGERADSRPRIPRFSLGPRPAYSYHSFTSHAAPPTIAELPELDILLGEFPATPGTPRTPTTPVTPPGTGVAHPPRISSLSVEPLSTASQEAEVEPASPGQKSLEDWSSMTSTIVERSAIARAVAEAAAMAAGDSTRGSIDATVMGPALPGPPR
jgi:hypothetical protein